MMASGKEQVFHKGRSIIFTARAFGRPLREVGVVHQFVDERGGGAARLREPSVFVETLTAAAEVLDEGVDQDICRASVEGEDLRRFAGGGEDGDIGDSAEVERDPAEFWMAVEEIVGVGDERGALAAEGDVGGAEVGNRGDAGAGSDDAAFAGLQRGGCRAAEIFHRWALVEDGLAVIGEKRDFFRRDAEAFAGGQGCFGVDLTEAEIELAQVAGGNESLFCDAEDFFAHLRGKIDGCVIEELGVEVWGGTGDFGQSDIDAVGGGAGHHAEDEERFVRGWQGGKKISPQRARRAQRRKSAVGREGNVVELVLFGGGWCIPFSSWTRIEVACDRRIAC